MNKNNITTAGERTQFEIREMFWDWHPQFRDERDHQKSQNDYRADIRMAFCDFVDTLARNGEISEEIAYNVTL